MLEWGQIITLTMIAVALGTDAFSLGLGMGMKKIPFYQMIILTASIGLLHFFMPLFGMMIGQYLNVWLKEIAVGIGGGLLCILGGKMILRDNQIEEQVQIQSLIQLFLLSMSVSFDSLSVGLSMGLFASNQVLVVSMFGCVGALMTGLGLWLGKFTGQWLGNAGERLGGIILILLGVKFIW